MKEKKPVTKQAFLNQYKSPPMPQPRGASQVFGLSIETTYTKSHLQPKRVEWIPNYNLFTSSCEKTLHLFDIHGNQKNSLSFPDSLRTQGFSCVVYVNKFHVFLGFSYDFKVFILSDLLELWHVAQLDPGRAQHALFLEETNQLVVCGIDKIDIYRFVVKSKYDIAKSLLLDPNGGYVEFHLSLEKTVKPVMNWMKGVRLDLPNNQLSIWSESSVNLMNLTSFSLLMQAHDLCPGTLMTDFLYSLAQEYSICGTSEGQIYVYKTSPATRLVHTFPGHIRGIASLAAHHNSAYFLSAGLDLTVKLWSLGLFELLYNFRIPGASSAGFMNFFGSSHLAYYSNHKLYVARMNFLGECFAVTKTHVRKLLWIDGKVGVLGEDNSVVLYEQNGKVWSTIYPPPTANDVRDIFYIEEIQRVVMLLSSGSLCIFKCQGETGLLVKIIYTGDIKDLKNRSIAFPVRCFKPVVTEPPHFDCEETIERKAKNEPGFFDQYPAQHPHKFVAMSLGKGTVIFAPIEHLTTVYSRYIIHRESIAMIEEIPGHFITMCLGNIFIVSRFTTEELTPIRRLDLRRPLKGLTALPPNRLLLSLFNGDSEVLCLNDVELTRSCSKLAGIDTTLTSIAVSSNFFVAVSPDAKLKKINFSKFLKQEVTLPEAASALLLLDDKVLVGHGTTLTQVQLLEFENSSGEEEEEVLTDNFFRENFRETLRDTTREAGFTEFPQRVTAGEAKFEEPAITEEDWKNAMNEYAKLQDPQFLTRPEASKAKLPKTSAKRSSRKPKKQKRAISPTTQQLQEEYKRLVQAPLPSFPAPRPPKAPVLLTRRQLTEERIIENIRKYGDPAERIDPRGLCVIDEALYFQELSRIQEQEDL